MKKGIFSFTLSVMLFFALCCSADAQQPKIPRIGYLSPGGDPNAPGFQVEAFRRGLQELGYVEGKNILIEYRYAEGKPDRRLSLVRELCNSKLTCLSLRLWIRSAKPSR